MDGNALNDKNDMRPSQNEESKEHSVKKETFCNTASETVMETVKFNHKWNIEHFSVQQELSQVGESLESSPFGTDNKSYNFRLKLFPCGKDEECRGYLSLFLQIQKCPSAKMRFRINFYIETTEGPKGCALNRNVVVINKGGIVTASKFFNMDTLKQKMSQFVPQDILTVGVELTVFCDQISREKTFNAPKPKITENRPHQGTIQYDFSQFFRTMHASDAILRVNEKEFDVHRSILMARSPVFSATFNRSTNEHITGLVNIEDATIEGVAGVLEWIYTDQCTTLEKDAEYVLILAERYCIDKLKEVCEQYLVRKLTTDNVVYNLQLADEHNATLLKNEALMVLFKNKRILEDEGWEILERNCPLLAAKLLREIITCSTEGQLVLNKEIIKTRPESSMLAVQKRVEERREWPRLTIGVKHTTITKSKPDFLDDSVNKERSKTGIEEQQASTSEEPSYKISKAAKVQNRKRSYAETPKSVNN